MSKQTQALERAATDCHRRGIGWATFWQRHGPDVCRAEQYDRARFRRLVRHLLHLLTSGEASGEHPVAVGHLWGEAWDDDDGAYPSPGG